jgi:chemotaxis family two-component system sensor histidine kinase/response regulator PixL
MSQDKELEIQLQFLDEAQEYLGALEIALLGIANSGVDIDKINAALRAAHSIKGGAGMMGFQELSQLAHRLEDSFKVLKIQKHSIQIDPELEGLLLTGVDLIRQVISWTRQDHPIDSYWLDTEAAPVLDQLYERLGEPEPEDAHSILAPEEGQDVVPLLFQTEVEGCLQRLESVLAAHDPCLREEVDILAQELGGLGEMLQLSAFTQLCESVTQHLAAAPDRVEEVAELALQAWRRSQALVLTGHLDALPSAIEGASFVIDLDSMSLSESEAVWSELDMAWPETDITEPFFETQAADNLFAPPVEVENEISFADTLADISVHEPVDAVADDSLYSVDDLNNASTNSSSSVEPSSFISMAVPFEPGAPETMPPEFGSSGPSTTANESWVVKAVQPDIRREQATGRTAEYRIADTSPVNAPAGKEPQENTVRVPVKHLDQLNDLFGELTIERNGLDLHLKRLRNLIQMLSRRVQVLDQSNAQLRDAYDKVETQTASPVTTPFLLPAATYPAPVGTDDGGNFEHIDHRFDVLEMDRYDDLHLLSQEVMETVVQIQEVTSDIELSLDDTEQTARELNKTSRQLRSRLAQVRMRPFSDITDRFPRALRELSLQYGKPVQLKIQGEQVLIDRNILEALSDPLMHLIRNAFDHGIEDAALRQARGKSEQGLIQITAVHRNNRTVITIKDDGGGIALDKIRSRARQMGLDEILLAAASDEELLSLIFEPGFTTSDQVTALSGRGVGMDVVRERLKQIHGEIKVDTQTGMGTTFTLSVPFTLSVTKVLIAESHTMLLAFPIDVVEEMLIVQPDQIIASAGSEVFSWQGTMIQLVRLSQWLEFRRPSLMEELETPAAISTPTVLMVNQGSQVVGLQVDRCWGEQEVAIRKVEGDLPLPPGFNNCTILGDGRVVPLVNVPELLHWIVSYERSRVDASRMEAALSLPQSLLPAVLSLKAAAPPPLPEQQPTILIVDDSINVRRFLALTLEKAGYQVAQAKDGQDALDKLSAGLMVQAVICDIEMPRLDGYGFLARIKSTPTFEQLPVAMLTSRSGDKHRQLAMNLGATAYFSKPYNEQSLLQTLERMVDLTPA